MTGERLCVRTHEVGSTPIKFKCTYTLDDVARWFHHDRSSGFIAVKTTGEGGLFTALRLNTELAQLRDEDDLEGDGSWDNSYIVRVERAGRSAHEDPPAQPQPLRRSMLKADWNEGILGRLNDKKCVKRDKTVEQLRVLVEKMGFVLLKAPPRSGKTGLLQLLEMSYPEDRLCAVNMTDKQPGMPWREFFEEQTKRSWQKCRSSGGGSDTPPQDDTVILLLIDELQSAYPTAQQRSAGCDPMDELWTFIKHLAAADARARQYPLRIVAAAVYGDAPSYTTVGSAAIADMLQSHATTPFEIGDDRQVRLHRSDADPDHPAMAYRDEEFDELWTLTWTGHESELFAGTATKEGIRWVTAKQPGVVAFILDNMERSVKDYKRSAKDDNQMADLQVQYLGDNAYRNMFRTRTMYDALQGTRSFLKLHDLSDDTELQLRLLRPLVEAGCGVEGSPEGAAADDLSEADRAHLAKCLKRGYLISHNHPVRGVLYSCATPLHLYFLEQQLLRARVQAVQEGPKSFATFLQLIITRMSPHSLVQTLSVGSSTAGVKGASAGRAAASGNILLERKLQMDLHATAISLVPDKWTVCPDVGKVYGAPGLVDMWVASPDKTVQWAVEFIRNGSDLLEHERRFLPGGKYYSMPHTEFALIDFRTPQSPSPRERPGKHATYFVVFEAAYKAATMFRASDMSVLWGPTSLLGD